MFKIIIITLAFGVNMSASIVHGEQEVLTFQGSSDSSAAFGVGDNRYVVADDENNILRVYDIDKPDLPVQTMTDMQQFLSDVDDSEADIEASAIIGDTVFWIGSHGRNKKGKLRPARQVFCAAKIDVSKNGEVKFEFMGRPYRRLLHDLVASSIGRELNLARVVRFDDPEKKSLAPKKDGINIEGMTAGPAGSLYIGFRNPLFDSKALVVKLLNPQDVVQGNAACKFEGPILLDLNKRGIRSMEYDAAAEVCYIIAGEKDSENDFSVYSWTLDGKGMPDEILNIDSKDNFNSEAMFVRAGKLYLLSDDGAMPVKVSSPAECVVGEMLPDGTCPNKYLVDQNAKTFRMKVYSLK